MQNRRDFMYKYEVYLVKVNVDVEAQVVEAMGLEARVSDMKGLTALHDPVVSASSAASSPVLPRHPTRGGRALSGRTAREACSSYDCLASS